MSMHPRQCLGWGITVVLVGLLAASCGGGSTGASLEPDGLAPATSVARTTGVLINETEIATLPDWQQEKMADTGWGQPYITPVAETAMPAPTWEMLEEYLASERGRDLQIQPRLAAGKGASWLDQGSFDWQVPVMLGEYDCYTRAETPAYGCNSNGENGTGEHAFEDVIRAGTKYEPQSISYVLNGVSEPNWFNRTGGTGNDAQSAVYQLFASTRDVDAHDWEDLSAVFFEELSYRADLAPGVGPGGDCSAAEAFLVAGLFWKRFNSVTTALPNLEETYVHNILIAPSGEESDPYTSSGNTQGSYQEFYCGDLSACYGGGWIVGVESSMSGCAEFDTKIVEAYDAGSPWFFSPVFGVLLKRWQDARISSMAGPWESWFGWPIAGPVPYDGGRLQHSVKGTYYAWAMWFERGFIWWLDYDQELYPEVPDEAKCYIFTGNNVMCPETGYYKPLGDTVYYGGESPWTEPCGRPRVVVVMDSYRHLPTDDWKNCGLSEKHEVLLRLQNDGLSTVNVAMHAHAWGGTPNADGSYNYYVWAFRDGTIFMGNEAEAQYVTHTYGSDLRNEEGVYTVRVQVTDSTGAVAYGDSRPIILGHSGTANYR